MWPGTQVPLRMLQERSLTWESLVHSKMFQHLRNLKPSMATLPLFPGLSGVGHTLRLSISLEQGHIGHGTGKAHLPQWSLAAPLPQGVTN